MTESDISEAKKRITWSEAEYEMVAAALIGRFPRRSYARAASEADLAMSSDELRAAIGLALPPERHRPVREPWKVKPQLLQAIFRLREKGAISEAALKRAKRPKAQPKPPEAYVTWTEAEWYDFAIKVHTMHPQFDFMRAEAMAGLTLMHLNDAGAAMPAGRQRTFKALALARARLLTIYQKTLARVGPDFLKPDMLPADMAAALAEAAPPVAVPPPVKVAPPAPAPVADKAPAGKFIRWTDAEWDAVARELLRRQPHYGTDTGMAGLNVKHMMDAQRVLPAARHRTYSSLAVHKYSRPPLLAALARVKASPAPAEPVEQAAVQAEPAAAVELQDAHVAPAEPAELVEDAAGEIEPDGRPKIFWTREEWLSVARELCRLNPRTNYLAEAGLETITGIDLQEAQRVLPMERQRPRTSLGALANALPNLQRAFDRIQLDMETQAPAPEPVAPPAPVAAPVNPWEAAFKPLVGLLAAELVPALIPALTDALVPMIQQAVQQAADRAKAQRDLPFVAPQRPPAPVQDAAPQATGHGLGSLAAMIAAANGGVPLPNTDDDEPKSEPPRPAAKPVVGVVGPIPAQQRALEDAYPNLKLVFIEDTNQSGKAISALHSCSRVIGMTKFMQHQLDKPLRTVFGERYSRVTGGVSSIKHQLDVWLATGDIGFNERRAVPR